jgi:putative ABC transport system substrate-binding protein
MLGVLLEVPFDRQLAIIHNLLPNAKRLGVLYDPSKTGPTITEARRQAKASGFELNVRPVSSDKDIPVATRALLPQVDALWLIPDSTVLNEDSLRFLLGVSLDLTVPIVGFSAEFVRSGALLGLSVSYPDTGRQAGQLAKRLLEGRLLPRGDTVAPDHIRLSLNQKTAKFLRLTIPEEILRQVEDLY